MLINRCEDGMMYFPFREISHLKLQEARLETLVKPCGREHFKKANVYACEQACVFQPKTLLPLICTKGK